MINNLINLSKRELEILYFIAMLKKNSEISFHCSISTHTVETHKQNLKIKLGLGSSAELTAFAFVNKDIIINRLDYLKIKTIGSKNLNGGGAIAETTIFKLLAKMAVSIIDS
ncbi:MAG: helix-turn-helix transcriptional regulator [Ignavibacterium sp.]|nr:helix-turn-helix transcriptional regulator [Ignavibacterium sp.]